MSKPPHDEWVLTDFSSGDWCVLHVWTGEKYVELMEGTWSADKLKETYGLLAEAFTAAVQGRA